MFIFTLAFLLGDMSLILFSTLPSPIMIMIVSGILFFIAGLIMVQCKKLKIVAYFLLGFTCGLLWTFLAAHSLLSLKLPHEWESKPLQVIGEVASMPIKDLHGTTFIFHTHHIAGQPIKQNIRLLARDGVDFRPGDEWQFTVKLKRIHGTENPNSFDFEAWSLQKKLYATGYVLPLQNKLLEHHLHYLVDQCRDKIQNKLQALLPSSPLAPWLLALTVGERSNILEKDWSVLRNTGTNHLMAIAGLHIGTLATIIHFLFSKIWRFSTCALLWLPAQQVGLIAALIAAIIYSAIAGFSLPTTRACIMLLVITLVILSKRKILIWHPFAIAMLVVLIFNPFNPLTDSFWLSFGTIAFIIYGTSGRLGKNKWWIKSGRVQFVIGMGLIPLSLLFYQQASLIAFFANAVAIPWLAFFILPFCWLSLLFLFIVPSWAAFFLLCADKSLTILWIILSWFAQLKIATFHCAIPNAFLFFLTLIGIIWLLAPAKLPGKWMGVVYLFPLFFYQPQALLPGEIKLTLLDVGQGLATVVQTKNHILIFDAGPHYEGHVNLGESVVLPFLQSRFIKQVDMLVVSHGDNDHIGGASAIYESLPVKFIRTSVPDKINLPQTHYCLAGETWCWDDVTFTFLYPNENMLAKGNDSSCVLRIDNGKKTILLTGDIEKVAERFLVQHQLSQLFATILVAPHHGSKTSGLSSFLKAVSPQYVIYATGYRNRYHFPHPNIVSAYTAINAKQFNTAFTGALEFDLQDDVVFSAYRSTHKRYWYDEENTT